MGQPYSNAVAPSESAHRPVISSEHSMASIPPSAPSTMAGTSARAGTLARKDNVDAAPPCEITTLTIPTPSPPAAFSTALAAPNAANGPCHRSASDNTQEAEAEADAWPLVTKSLMVVVIGSQPPAMAASTLLCVFCPIVDGWATAQREGKRWKERAEVYMAEHHKHKTELAHKHHTLQAQVKRLQQSLADSQARMGELESEQSTFVTKVSSLEKTLATVEAQARAVKEAHAQETQQKKQEVEATAKSAQESRSMHEKLRQESENKTRAHIADVAKLQDKIKEMETTKAKVEEQLGSTIAKTTSVEEELAHKLQDISTLQTSIAELTTRKEALERQLANYQRVPTRRWRW